MEAIRKENLDELKKVCDEVRKNYETMTTEVLIRIVSEAMVNSPHSAIPHNLMGLVLEKDGDHTNAMKHFRAAYALDPTHLATRHNLDYFGNFYKFGTMAFDDSDCDKSSTNFMGE